MTVRGQLGEDRKDLCRGGGTDRFQRFRPGEQRFRLRAIGQHDLMCIEQKVDISDLCQIMRHVDPVDLAKLFGGDQNLHRAEHLERDFRAHEHPVLGRDDQIGMRQPLTKRTLTDTDRAKMRVGAQDCGTHPALADPADRLKPRIAGFDQIADCQITSRNLARIGADQRVGTETEDIGVVIGQRGRGAVGIDDRHGERILDPVAINIRIHLFEIVENAIRLIGLHPLQRIAVGRLAGLASDEVIIIQTDLIIVSAEVYEIVIGLILVANILTGCGVEIVDRIAVAGNEGVKTLATRQTVGVRAAVDQILTVTAEDPVTSRIAVKRVIADPAR